MRYRTRKSFSILVLAVISVFAVSDVFAAGQGFYMGLEAGFSRSDGVDVSQSAINNPTKCDSLLYPSGTNPPADPDCAIGDKMPLISSMFSASNGFVGGASLGYSLDSGVRIEAEYLHRRDGSERRNVDLGSAGNDPLSTKDSEWSESSPPFERLRDFKADQFFLNAYYDFQNESRVTPYIGGGIGVASLRMRYKAEFLRKDDLGSEPWQIAAAGTASRVDTALENTSFGFQVIGGFDYSLGDKTSIGVKGRWTRFNGFDENDKLWEEIRGHVPVLADGTTPFTSDFEVDDISNWAVSLTVKYYL